MGQFLYGSVWPNPSSMPLNGLQDYEREGFVDVDATRISGCGLAYVVGCCDLDYGCIATRSRSGVAVAGTRGY